MSQVLQDIVKSYQSLLSVWKNPNCDLGSVGEILELLKHKLTTISFLPATNEAATKQELLLARDILEVGANWSIDTKNIPSFINYLSQLKHYYFDFKNDLPSSSYKYELLALNLLRLLAQDKLADFHKELDLLTPEEKSNVYIKYPISMEQYLMEGWYNKVFLSKINVPSPRFTFFMDILLNTTRKEIANCIEAGHDSLPVKELERMLFFSDKDDLRNFAKEREWLCDSVEGYHFNKENKSEVEEVPYKKIALTMLEYAIELEKIV